jgi:hypothetical protein
VVTDLVVRRASLEDTYLAIVRRHESGPASAAAPLTGARS